MKEKKVNLHINLKSILINMKKVLAVWITASILSAVAVSSVNVVSDAMKGAVSTSINFNFNGIEDGFDPIGNKFSIYDMKSNEIIKDTLSELGITASAEVIADIKNNISISGLVPANVIKNITLPNSVIGEDKINTLNEIKDTSYNPTQYQITFAYSKAGYNKTEGADILNKITEKYGEYFYSSYGYNSSIEDAILSIDYNDYDYAEAVDVIGSSLDSLISYTNYLGNTDNTRYISIETGYSFADLQKAIQTLKNEKLSWVKSFIVSNNVTKNKSNLINYYQYKINNAEFSKQSYQEQLNNITTMIEDYKKTNAIVLGLNDESEREVSYSQPSETYDSLINLKIDYQRKISTNTENITFYKDRIESLKKLSSSENDNETVEKYLSELQDDIHELLDIVNVTATEYYTTVRLFEAYEIISPADTSILSYISSVKDSLNTVIAVEMIIFSLYLSYGVIIEVMTLNGKEAKLFKKKKLNNTGDKKDGEK